MRNICRVTAQLWSRGLPRTNHRLFWGIELPPAFSPSTPAVVIGDDVVWYQTGQGSSQEKENFASKTARKATGNHIR